MRSQHVGVVYGALAAGADIIFAETALALGAEFAAVLPFTTERFIETSVKIGDPPGQADKWEKRLRAILDGSRGPCSLTLMDPTEPAERGLGSYYFYAFRYAGGLALQRAAVLQTNCRLIAVSDAAGPDSFGGTNRAVADWSAHGRAFDLIAYPHERPQRSQRGEDLDGFRPAVFLWDAAPGGSDKESVLDKIGKSCAMAERPIERTHRDGRRGLCLIAGSTKEALDAGLAAAEAARKAKAAVRIICDFGPVLGGGRAPDKKLIARLQAADDLPGLPGNCVLATESYAAQAKFDLGETIHLVPVSRVEATGEDSERQTARSRPSLPIYTAEWVKGVAKI